VDSTRAALFCRQPTVMKVVSTAIVFAALVIVSGGCVPGSTTQATGSPRVEPAQQSAPPGEAAAPESVVGAVASDAPTAPTPVPEPAIQTVAVAVTHVTDGDTIDVRMPDGSTESVRFIGVDTPETAFGTEPYGAEASTFTSRALADRTVYLEIDAARRDRYGRLLAHVWLEVPRQVDDAEIRAHLFNAHLLLAGYANLMTIPPNVKYVDYLAGYESEARAASVGLWALPPAGVPPPVTRTAPGPAPPGAAYIANGNTGKFHHASCGSVGDMKESNKVPYQSRDAAVADGYVPCKRCDP